MLALTRAVLAQKLAEVAAAPAGAWRVWIYGESGALESMKLLNRLAKHLDDYYDREGPARWEIYEWKAALVRHLYGRFPCEVRRQVQTLWCSRCSGTGWWRSDSGRHADVCRKCGGSRIYRQHTLLSFVFTVHGARYAFHQLEEKVPYPVQVEPGEPEPYSGSSGRGASPGLLAREIAAATVRRYLEGAGALPARPAYPHRFRTTLHKAWSEDRRRLAAAWERLLIRLGYPDPDADLPF